MPDAELPFLFLDASGLATRAGLWQNSRWLAYREEPAPALEALFPSVRAILVDAGLTLPQIGGFFYISGPGSVLGLRLAAMAIRTWQTDHPSPALPVLSCGSLHLAAALTLSSGVQPPFTISTDARQGRWHLLSVTTADLSALAQTSPRETDAADLAQLPGPLFHLPARKAWQNLPRPSSPVPASLRDHPEILATSCLFHATPTATPSAISAEYRKWNHLTVIA
jgi:tRNA threonylcarbamoyladenosine biosynthesis protein TsaB